MPPVIGPPSLRAVLTWGTTLRSVLAPGRR